MGMFACVADIPLFDSSSFGFDSDGYLPTGYPWNSNSFAADPLPRFDTPCAGARRSTSADPWSPGGPDATAADANR